MAPSSKSNNRRSLPIARPNVGQKSNGNQPKSQHERASAKAKKFKAHCEEVMAKLLDELDNLPVSPETGKIRRGAKKSITDLYLAANSSWLTEEMIKGRRKRRKKARAATTPVDLENSVDQSQTQFQTPPLRPRPERTALEDLKPVAAPGRKKGSTIAAMEEKQRKFVDMKNEIVKVWADKTSRPDCTLKELIALKQDQFGFDPNNSEYRVTVSMVASRLRRGQVENQGTKGQSSPLKTIEPRIVMMIKHASSCNQDLTEAEILEFVNDYIQGSSLEKTYIDWKLRNNGAWRNKFLADGIRPVRADITSSWFHGLLSRWKDEISFSKAKNTAFYRKEHCTYANFSRMYDNVYKLLEEGGYAERLPQKVFYNDAGELCESADSYGLPVDLSFTKPEFVFVADECGTNTNMSNDRLSGGNKRAHTKGTSVTLPSCTSDTHFTTLGFQSLDGRPVCCVIIIQSTRKLNQSELHGFDIDAKWHGDLSIFDEIKERQADKTKVSDIPPLPARLLRENMGEGKAFPGGPWCEFNGKNIPPYVTHSESGGITPRILVNILKHLDFYGATNRDAGNPPPCLIVDGHGSRLSIPFLRYINNLDDEGSPDPQANHRWRCFIGLPNGTAYWQVADSSQVNGKYKLKMRKQKESVRNTQRANNERIQIKRYDVVPMVRRCWDTCFGDIEGNKKAILERGWNPLNRGCLVMPDILKTKKTTVESSSQSTTNNNNNSTNNDDDNTLWHCASQRLCQLDNRPLTSKDFHKCASCGKRVHGPLCCVLQTEEEEGNGPLYCLKCGRPGEKRTESLPSNDKKPRSELLEELYSKNDPRHGKDMNASGVKVNKVMAMFQDSDRRDLAFEAQQKKLREKVARERGENKFMGMITSKWTAGMLAGAGEHDLSQPAVLKLFEAKEQLKLENELAKRQKQYEKDKKVYEEGIEVMAREKLHSEVLVRLRSREVRSNDDRIAIVKEAKREKKWLFAADFLSLIKFKQLRIAKADRTPIPPLLEARKNHWYSIYKALPDPEEPAEPRRSDIEGIRRQESIDDEVVEQETEHGEVGI